MEFVELINPTTVLGEIKEVLAILRDKKTWIIFTLATGI